MEIWKPVVGFEGLYEVSDQGRVRSLPRVTQVKNRWGNLVDRKFPGKVLSAANSKNRSNRRFVGLSANKTQTVKLVAHLVAEAFLGNRPVGHQVCHNNGDATDDRAVNLRYDTPAGNMADCLAHGTRPKGETHGSARLTSDDVVKIRAAVAAGAKQKDVAVEFGVHAKYVSLVVARSRWAHV